MRSPSLSIPRWQRRWLYASFLLLMTTGLGWLALDLTRDPEALPSPVMAWSLRLHGLGSMAMLLALGMVLGQHLVPGWRITRRPGLRGRRRSGLLLLTTLSITVLLAYALYYLTNDDTHGGVGWVHAGVGALALPLWGMHRPRKSRHRES